MTLDRFREKKLTVQISQINTPSSGASLSYCLLSDCPGKYRNIGTYRNIYMKRYMKTCEADFF